MKKCNTAIARNHQGGALLTALFIMTLIAIIATALSTRIQLDIYRTQLMIVHDKMTLAAEAIKFWSLQQLSTKQNQLKKMHPEGYIAQLPQNMKNLVNQIHLEGALYDAQSRLNVNNLSDQRALISFILLLRTAMPNLTETEQRNMTLSLYDWLRPYNIGRGIDNYISYYQSLKPPYYPSHQKIQNISELRLIKNFTPERIKALEPYITALPEPTPININTASETVLKTLGSGLKQEEIKAIIAARSNNGIKNINDITPILQTLGIPSAQVTVESNFFLSIAKAQSGEHHLIVSTWYKRSKDKNGNISIRVIREQIL